MFIRINQVDDNNTAVVDNNKTPSLLWSIEGTYHSADFPPDKPITHLHCHSYATIAFTYRSNQPKFDVENYHSWTFLDGFSSQGWWFNPHQQPLVSRNRVHHSLLLSTPEKTSKSFLRSYAEAGFHVWAHLYGLWVPCLCSGVYQLTNYSPTIRH